jgi:TRAP-type mannitol/chloroaromatic compound transport system substrate-binding protein
MTRKICMLVLSVAIVASLILAGCAPEVAPPPAEEEEEAAPEEEEEEEEAPPTAPEAEVIKWTWQDNSGPGTTQLIMLEELAKRVKAATGGTFDISVVAEGTIVPRAESTAAVRDGMLDLATNCPSVDEGRLGPIVYICGASGLPAGPSSMDGVAWAYKGEGLEIMSEVWKDWAYVIGVQPGAPELFCHSNKKLEKASDLKGLKFRTRGMWAEILGEYGVAVVIIAGGELYSSVERGVLDAFELGPPSFNWPYGFQEVCKYIGLPGIQSPGYAKPVWVNKSSWDSLDAHLQDLLKDEIMTCALDTYMSQEIEDGAAIQKYLDYGTEIFYVSEELQTDIAQKSKALIEKFAAEDPQFAEVWEQRQAFNKEWTSLTGIVPDYTIFD